MESAVGVTPIPMNECLEPCLGYYLATLEAATQHIVTLAQQFEEIDKADQVFTNDLNAPNDEAADDLY